MTALDYAKTWAQEHKGQAQIIRPRCKLGSGIHYWNYHSDLPKGKIYSCKNCNTVKICYWASTDSVGPSSMAYVWGPTD